MHVYPVTTIISELREYPQFVGKRGSRISPFHNFRGTCLSTYNACRRLCVSGGPHPSRRCRASTRSSCWTAGHPLRDPLHLTCKIVSGDGCPPKDWRQRDSRTYKARDHLCACSWPLIPSCGRCPIPGANLCDPCTIGTISDLLPTVQVPASTEASTIVQHPLRTRCHGREVLGRSYGRSGRGWEGRSVHRSVVGVLETVAGRGNSTGVYESSVEYLV